MIYFPVDLNRSASILPFKSVPPVFLLSETTRGMPTECQISATSQRLKVERDSAKYNVD